MGSENYSCVQDVPKVLFSPLGHSVDIVRAIGLTEHAFRLS